MKEGAAAFSSGLFTFTAEDVGQDNDGALRRKKFGLGRPLTPSCSGHDRYFVFQSRHRVACSHVYDQQRNRRSEQQARRALARVPHAGSHTIDRKQQGPPQSLIVTVGLAGPSQQVDLQHV